jgi:hypothetical protein
MGFCFGIRNDVSSALQQERLNSQKFSSQSAAKKAGPRVPVSINPTVSSQSKKTGKKELAGIVGMQHMKNQTKTQGATKKTSDQSANRKEESKGVAANLPLDSLYLCFEKLESVYDIVTCASVCHHWQQAASSDLVSPLNLDFSFVLYLGDFSDLPYTSQQHFLGGRM